MDGWMDGRRGESRRPEEGEGCLISLLCSQVGTFDRIGAAGASESGGGSSAGSRLFNPILPPHRHFPNMQFVDFNVKVRIEHKITRTSAGTCDMYLHLHEHETLLVHLIPQYGIL